MVAYAREVSAGDRGCEIPFVINSGARCSGVLPQSNRVKITVGGVFNYCNSVTALCWGPELSCVLDLTVGGVEERHVAAGSGVEFRCETVT